MGFKEPPSGGCADFEPATQKEVGFKPGAGKIYLNRRRWWIFAKQHTQKEANPLTNVAENFAPMGFFAHLGGKLEIFGGNYPLFVSVMYAETRIIRPDQK